MRNAAMHRRNYPLGFSLVELLTVAGIVAVLAALLLPALQMAREASRKTHCINNLKQIGLAIHSYHEAHKMLPPGYVSEWGRYGTDIGPGWGWAAMILPHLDEDIVFETVNFERNVESLENSTARLMRISTYLCASDNMPEKFPVSRDIVKVLYGQIWEWHDEICKVAGSNYVGVFGIGEPGVDGDGLFFRNSKLRMKDIRDGLSSTLAVGERAVNLNHGRGTATWVGSVTPAFMYSCGPNHADPDAVGGCIKEAASGLTLGHTGEGNGPGDIWGDTNQFSSQHGFNSHFLFADGHVALLHASMNYQLYKALSTREGREITDGVGF